MRIFAQIVVTLGIATLGLAPPAAAGEPDKFFGLQQDKVLHFSVSALLSSGSIKLLQAASAQHEVTAITRVIASFATLGLGYAKERRDKSEFDHPIDQGDMTANIMGVMTGNLLQWQF